LNMNGTMLPANGTGVTAMKCGSLMMMDICKNVLPASTIYRSKKWNESLDEEEQIVADEFMFGDNVFCG